MLVCDRCKADDAERYTVIYPTGPVQLDLCERHAKPLEGLKDLGVPVPGQFAARERSTSRHQIVPTDPKDLGLE